MGTGVSCRAEEQRLDQKVSTRLLQSRVISELCWRQRSFLSLLCRRCEFPVYTIEDSVLLGLLGAPVRAWGTSEMRRFGAKSSEQKS